ncbi:GspH/FimT family pseudopilin [Pseudomonas entomophila]|jgi:type IV fimbrial biogenesis protein FimT|uniref:GspH/FimT family pseudopilin n=1 Tax=Pseudomonas entomophila TaxID=312306 RepID=UPI001C6156E7|nr:GspH/FimT family protein [Pseudomonas entomophila]
MQRGATLIQIMFGLALAGVLTQVSLSAYGPLSDALHRAMLARELAQALRLARGQALLHGEVMALQPLESGWAAGWQVVRAKDRQIMREQRFAQRARVGIAGTTGREIRFSAQGVPLAGHGTLRNGTFHVCDAKAGWSRHQVVWASSGRISLRTEDLAEPRCAGR